MRGYEAESEEKVAAYRSCQSSFRTVATLRRKNSTPSPEAFFPPSLQTWRSWKRWEERRGGRGEGKRWREGGKKQARKGERECVREKEVEVTDVG